MDVKQIKKDRLRFTKNSLSSSLTYLAILFDVFYFVSIYKSDIGNYYYNWLVGSSIIVNLLFLLAGFLCSEGVKNYHFGYSVTLIVLAVIQIVRIFIIPLKAHSATVKVGEVEEIVMGNAQFTRILIYLIASAALCFIAGVVGIYKSTTLKNYMKEIDAK